MSKKKKVPQANETMVYVGKTYTNIVTHGDIFSNGIPNKLKQLSEKNPMVAVLIIPIKDLPIATKAIRSKKGKYYAAYIKTGGK